MIRSSTVPMSFGDDRDDGVFLQIKKNCFDDLITFRGKDRKIRIQIDLSRNVKKQVERKDGVQAFIPCTPLSIFKSTQGSVARLGSARPRTGFGSI